METRLVFMKWVTSLGYQTRRLNSVRRVLSKYNVVYFSPEQEYVLCYLEV